MKCDVTVGHGLDHQPQRDHRQFTCPATGSYPQLSVSLHLPSCGVLSPMFMKIEEYLGRNTLDYYKVLALVGSGSWQPERDTRPWIRFILTAS